MARTSAYRATLAVAVGLAILACLRGAHAASAEEVATCLVDVQGTTLYCLPATFSSDLAEEGSAPALSVVAADPPEGCQLTATLPANTALLVARGNCTFAQKAALAAQAGAAAVIVRNTLKGMYLSATNMSNPSAKLQVSECDYDCSLKSIGVQASAATPAVAYKGYACGGGACSSGVCALDGKQTTGGEDQACCVLDDLMTIGGSWPSSEPRLPVVFVTVSEGEDLYARTTGGGVPPTVRIYSRPISVFNFSSVVIWFLGCSAAFIAAWRSARRERQAVKARASGTAAPRPSAGEIEPVEMSITMPQAVAFLCCATAMLVTLYFLIQAGFNVVIVIIVVFSLGAISSTTTMVWAPLVAYVRPSLARGSYNVYALGKVTYNQMIGFGLAVALVLVWFLVRHSDWAWVLQDFFGICLCCLFILTLRLPSLRTATGLLVLFFLYDIFMVFITPFIFKSSVMVEVATAGLPPEFANRDCYCRLHPDDSELCGPGETMPILLMFPRLGSWRGGYSMLGLGDVAIPGMLLSFLLRWDLCNHRRVKGGYFSVAMPGYCVGLALANLAVILMQLGQPALLYLVPCTLIPTAWLAHRRHELDTLWRGASLASRAEERRDPLVTADDSEEGVGLTTAAAGGGGEAAVDGADRESTRTASAVLT